MIPLKVTWLLSTPVMLGDYPLHLDGLLAWAKVQRSLQEGEEESFAAQEDLPLERTGDIWKASRVFFAPGPRIREPIVRKFENMSFARGKGSIWDGGIDKPQGGSGRHKAFLLTHDGFQTSKAIAWCVGDKEQVEDLLGDILHLGRYGRIGCGEVAQFSVESAKVSESEYWKCRNIPIEQGACRLPDIDYAKAIATVQAPYWDRVAARETYVPLEIPTGVYANLKQ